ncbi:DNA-protecting protein DprA [Clostridium bovifaecis]|uniref:DNA-protecting protein DprA n=1 Tax=Clostridium bovifaecis TaxID=2184719 RepID=A0A6I6ES35_9CLOT|nr:DNA-protecting protein DprA [Clostridium bovifaecis]
MNDYEIWYAISNLSYTTKNKLLNNFKSIQNIWYYSMHDEKNDYLGKEIKSVLREAWDKEKISFIKGSITRNDISTVVITDEMYPRRLKVYEDSPYMLFYKGDIGRLNEERNVAIVGSRNCTNYGINVTNIVTEYMCKSNVGIISGMARGIDTIAHKKCIERNSYTCAVLGAGIDIIYPKENSTLFNNILNYGCVLSQFIPGTKPFSFNFPIRNKIISALSDAVIVVEAGEKSGSLITAGAALDQGKDVIAVPGDIFASQSKGTNKLIRDGAFVLTSIEDVYEILKINKVDLHRENSNEMNKRERIVYDNIKTSPIHFDEVLRITKIDIKQLYEVLFELQLKDEIMCLSGNYYVRNNKKI